MSSSYPWYHEDRPKFFNQATLYIDIVGQLRYQIANYIRRVCEIIYKDYKTLSITNLIFLMLSM